jgi:hypothetical protein
MTSYAYDSLKRKTSETRNKKVSRRCREKVSVNGIEIFLLETQTAAWLARYEWNIRARFLWAVFGSAVPKAAVVTDRTIVGRMGGNDGQRRRAAGVCGTDGVPTRRGTG